MLTEHFIASIGVPEKQPTTNVAKDAGIFVHEYQPLSQQKAIFKKSATAPNCLAASRSHVFAAQADKSVVHVYNREKGNQEATVPFTERITCVTSACDDAVLILGTAEGRIFLWEIATGRQVTTAQSHLQAVTKIIVDRSSNYLLSASADTTVHVWSLPSLLSFSIVGAQALTPLRTFTSHRSAVTALALSHSSSTSSFVVSAAEDKTCYVWDFHTNAILRTYLLPGVPACLALDTADRAVYVGYGDGAIQQLDLYATIGLVCDAQEGSAPIQPAESSRWRSPDASKGAVLSMSLSFDSCTLLIGHQSGAVVAWDVATGRSHPNLMRDPLPGPVTNISFLPVSGFTQETQPSVRIPSVMKPKFGAFDSSDGLVPGNYAITAELASDRIAGPRSSDITGSLFQQALTAPSLPQSLLEEGLSELAAWGRGVGQSNNGTNEESDDFMALGGESNDGEEISLQAQNAALKAQLDGLRRLQTASFQKIDKINSERKSLLQREQDRLKKLKTNGKLASGTGVNNAAQLQDDMESMDDSD